MAKTKTVYVCQECGAESGKWVGKCPACKHWNTYVEEISIKNSKLDKISFSSKDNRPQLITEISAKNSDRIILKNKEINRVVGGGVVPGSLILLGGEPGIGKSTLMLQVAVEFDNTKVLYVSGEESVEQIKIRADRVKNKLSNTYILSDTHLENILAQAKNINPELIIIDSIQTVYTDRLDSTQGSVSQVKECANIILRFAKETNTTVFLIGHINKDGNIAGPKVLEHIVDTVLHFEGDRNYMYRILRTVKNRFGSTSELGIFQMESTGLKEVSNPSELLLSSNNENLSGTAIAATIEGVRPFLIEIQALVSSAAYGNPQRSSTGFDTRRLNMLLAVLEKRVGFKLSTKDVFLNIAGGIKVNDPSVDLSVIAAIFSSDQDLAINKSICFAGEVGLTGEIRPVNRIEQRISEAERLGFKHIFVSALNKGVSQAKHKIEIHLVSKVNTLFKEIFKI